MKCFAVVLGVVLFAATVTAQTNFTGAQLLVVPSPIADTVTPPEPAQPFTLFADATPGAVSMASPAFAGSGDPGAAQFRPITTRPGYLWEIYAGYTFFNFYEVPNLKNLENGFDVTADFFPGAGWIGVEGDFQATFGSQAGCISKFTMPSGGVRFRWAGPRGTQFFIHGTAGSSHFFPRTAYGGQNAFAYQAGGGIDVAHGRRIALRGEVDAVGTRFFGTYQYSPKFSLGVVFKF